MKNNMTIERTLDAPRSQVWAVLADYGNIVDWNSGIKASRVTGDAPDGVGARRHCDLSPAGSVEETILGWEPESELVISIDSSKNLPIKQGVVTFALDDGGETTPLKISYDYEAKGGPISGIVGKIMAGALRKGFNGFVDDLEVASKAVSA